MRIQRIENSNIIADNQQIVDLKLLDPIIEKYKNKKGNTIPILQSTQQIFGYIPSIAFEYISQKTGLKVSEMYGVATFYAQFRLKPVGKHIIKVCHGTACHVQGANALSDSILEALQIKDGETTPDGFYTVESVACLGCCSLAPVMMIDEDTYGKLTGKSAVNIIKEIKLKASN
ncbi:MAG: NADH-quinone oxidoreductase subunit NuoE [Bacteroidales bacterium]|nr:NADH-quinone oxidoreductase subunit NuoE [Bacteroidales bacterium]